MRRLILILTLLMSANCFALQKNVASQKWIVFAFDITDNTAKTGDAAQITANLRIDGVQNAVDDTNPTELEDGYYEFDITAAESNGDNILIAPASSTGSIQVIGAPMALWTTPENFNETALATRSQVDNIGAASGGSVNINITEDNTGGAIDPSSATFVGSVQGATTFVNLEAEDGVVHDIDDTGDDIDIVYGAAVGGGRTASLASIVANVDGNTDEIKVKAFDHVGADWEIIGTVEGSGGTSFKSLDLDLLLKHTGTGAELGKVYIRFETDTTTPSNLSVDKLIIKAVNIGQTVGYANGQIWIDTVNGVAGTEAFVNGVADNATNLIASGKTLSTSIGVSDFHIINGSTITLAESTTNESYFGDNWSLALNGQDVADAYFQGAHISGVGTSATEVHYEGCDVATMSVQIGHFDFCSFDGTVTMTLAGDYQYHNCYSNIAGAGAPTFTKTAGQAITAEWRNWMDGITVSGLQAGDTVTINGRLGTVTLNGADATVEIRGSYKSIVNNLTGSPTVNIAGAWQGSDIADTLADTNTLVTGVNLTSIDGQDTNGNNATLNLKKLNIVNNAGSAIVASSTGGNGSGIAASGNGSGSGIAGAGGATGAGLAGLGGATSGAGIFGLAQNNNDAGMQLIKDGTGVDLEADFSSDALDNILMSDLAAGAPSITASIVTAINYLYEAWRNKTESTSLEISIYKDDGTTKLVESDISDDGTTFTRGKMGAED